MDSKKIRENKLKMILQFSVPSIIAMLLQTVINLGLPVLYLYLGAGLCLGVGGSVISGRLLGAGEERKASEVFSQTMVTAGTVCVMISFLVFILFTPILKVLGADGALIGYFTEYYRIMLFTYPLMVAGTVLSMFIRVDLRGNVWLQRQGS